MQVHYDKTLERRVSPAAPAPEGSPARLVLSLARSLEEWFDQPCRAVCREGSGRLRFGYEVLSVPVMEFAQAFGALLCRVGKTWPVQVFGLAEGGELVELSFAEDGKDACLIRQHNLSGLWREEVRDLYLCLALPGPAEAECMSCLLSAAEQGLPAAALEWSCAPFLEEQRLAGLDRTLSFCYVSFVSTAAREDPAACLAGLTSDQKAVLWRLFLEKHLLPPEFEWLRDALLQDEVPNWIEWHLALYQVLEQLGIRFLCTGGQFELLDRTGRRLYFGVDHGSAAEQVLMKILFPLNQ